MNASEIKIKLFRLLDQQEETILQDLYHFLISKAFTSQKKLSSEDFLEMSYLAMSKDSAREKEAMDWIENSSDFNGL